jgi:hypothetical protein
VSCRRRANSRERGGDRRVNERGAPPARAAQREGRHAERVGDVDLGAEDKHRSARLGSGEEGLGQLTEPEQAEDPPRAAPEGLMHEQGGAEPGKAQVQRAEPGAALAEMSHESLRSRLRH